MSARSAVDVAGRVLDLVRSQLGRAAEAEVLVAREELALTRFANSFIHQNVATVTTQVAMRLHIDGRTSSGTTTRLDPEGLRELVSRAASAARVLPPDALWAGTTPAAPLAGAGAVDEATAGATPDERAGRVRSFVDATGGFGAAGYCRTAYVGTAFGNTAGQSVSGGYTEAAFDGVARAAQPSAEADATADGVARAASSRLGDIDGALLGARAAAKARAAVNPAYLPPGTYEVVLEPAAVGDLLFNLAVHGFNGKVFAERQSFVNPGTEQFDPALSIVDDPFAARSFGLPYDVEGTPKRRLELVRAGTTRTVVHDRRTAKQLGTESTGHALMGSDVFGPFPTHLGFEPAARVPGEPPDAPAEVAGPATDSEVAALVGRVRRGLLVTDLWYTRVLDPRPLVITGLTRNGLWLIENGEVTGPVRNLRFTQAYPLALAPGRVLGIGRSATPLPSGWGSTAFQAPALHLASWRFTGGAQG